MIVDPWSDPGVQLTAMEESPRGSALTPTGGSGTPETVTVTVPLTPRAAEPVASSARTG